MMDAVKYLKTLRRMCNCECCSQCEIGKRLIVHETCTAWRKAHPEEAVAIVEQWDADHPIKTRQSEFLKMLPNVPLNDKGQPAFCPKLLDTEYHPVGSCCLDVDICQRCMDNFWGQEVEDV